MKKCVRNTLISEYLKIGGTVPKNQIQKILTKDLQYLFINREKNGACFSYIDIWYQIYKKVEEMQCLFLKQRNKKENFDENSIIKELNFLESLDSPSRHQQRRRNALCRALSDMQATKLRRRAEDASLDFHSLGESGSRFFLRSKTQRRAATFVRELETADGLILSRTDDIEKSFYKHYKELLSSEDPFSLQLYNEFIEPI